MWLTRRWRFAAEIALTRQSVLEPNACCSYGLVVVTISSSPWTFVVLDVTAVNRLSSLAYNSREKAIHYELKIRNRILSKQSTHDRITKPVSRFRPSVVSAARVEQSPHRVLCHGFQTVLAQMYSHYSSWSSLKEWGLSVRLPPESDLSLVNP